MILIYDTIFLYILFYLNILNTYFFKQMGNIIYNSQQEMKVLVVQSFFMYFLVTEWDRMKAIAACDLNDDYSRGRLSILGVLALWVIPTSLSKTWPVSGKCSVLGPLFRLETDHMPNLEIPKHHFLFEEQQQRHLVIFGWTNTLHKKLEPMMKCIVKACKIENWRHLH